MFIKQELYNTCGNRLQLLFLFQCKSFFSQKKKTPMPSRVPSAVGEPNENEGATAKPADPIAEEAAIENVR